MNIFKLVLLVVEFGLFDYLVDLFGEIRKFGNKVVVFDVILIVQELGDICFGNMVMFGVIVDYLFFLVEILLVCVL